MPPRRYDSTRRRQAAERTRQDIVRAALKLHWEGITEFAAIAEEAGCSLPTVRKHFPTKESLYQSCTRSFGETLVLPDVEALAAISSPKRQLDACVSELCRIHEAMFGYAWLMASQHGESATLHAEMQGYQSLADAIANILAPDRPSVRGFLDFLTYRALRLSVGLSPDDACAELVATLRPMIRINQKETNP